LTDDFLHDGLAVHRAFFRGGDFPLHLGGIVGNAAEDLGLEELEDFRTPLLELRVGVADRLTVAKFEGVRQRVGLNLGFVVIRDVARFVGNTEGVALGVFPGHFRFILVGRGWFLCRRLGMSQKGDKRQKDRDPARP
jgi:hypothetical protein